jgi:hypothetical protein
VFIKPEAYSLFIVDIPPAARNAGVQAYTVTKIFHRNVYSIRIVMKLGMLLML